MKPQPWLAPLSPIYSTVVSAKNAGYDRGFFSAKRLQGPVISVGNLSTGGGGKTPLVIALAKLLTEAGIAVDVLSRGYGRNNNFVERVAPDGSAERYGDEPLLIAQSAEVPVYVGSSRYAAGLLAERETQRVHLIDDGFQHRQLARDLDIVVIHRSDLTAQLLPAGHLREPLSSLRRAQVLVLREEDGELADSFKTEAERWQVRRRLVCETPDGPVVAFCGIARPEEFFAGLRALDIQSAATVAYADHHRYTDTDFRFLLDEARRVKANALVTTEKDAARLGSAGMATLTASVAVRVARLEVTLLEPGQALALIHHMIGTRVSPR
jgi:tetraacyldisaccharide 4'-kinase